MKQIDEILKKNRQLQSKNMGQDEAHSDNNKEWLCPVCGGAGCLRYDVPVGHPKFGKLVECACRRNKKNVNRIEKYRSISNMDVMRRFTFDSFKADSSRKLSIEKQTSLRNAYEAALDFANNPKGWLIFSGGYGCGKTHLAAAIANHLIEQGRLAIFVVVPDLLDHLRASYNPNSDSSYDKRFEDIRSAHILILDDLGTQSSTPWAKEKLFQIFNSRYNAQLPTIITTNQIVENIEPRIRSRIMDTELTKQIYITVSDFRQKNETNHDLSSLDLHQDQTFDSFKIDEHGDPNTKANLIFVVNAAKNFAANPDNWISFSGTYGCGKTHLAAAVANKISATKKLVVLFIVVPDLLDHLRASFSPTSTVPYDKKFEEIRKVPFLVLDDLGTESATPWAIEKMYQLLNYRYNARLPTVITMASEVDLNPRLKSLILDVNRCATVEIVAPSYRSQLEAKKEEYRNRNRNRNKNQWSKKR